MIDVAAVRGARLREKPFRHAEVRGPLSTASVMALVETLPRAGALSSTRESGSDKTYRVINNVLFALETQATRDGAALAGPWSELLGDLGSAAYLRAAGELLGLSLETCHREVTLKRYRRGDFISPHTDCAAVCATHLFFLNACWTDSWGGLLCLHEPSGEVSDRFAPQSGSSVLFARSAESWHSVTAVAVDGVERLSLQVAFWNTRRRSVAPGRSEESVA